MDKMRIRRRALGLTMKDLAACVGVSEAAISHYETGRREPDPDMLGRIANALGVTVDYLLGRDVAPVQSAEVMQDQKEMTPADMRAEAKKILEGMTDEQYQAALQFLKFLKAQRKDDQ